MTKQSFYMGGAAPRGQGEDAFRSFAGMDAGVEPKFTY